MRQFAKIFVMGLLALGVAHAAEDFSKLSNKDFIKKAGTMHDAEDVIHYKIEVAKRVKAMKSAKAKAEFKYQVRKTAKANFAKMGAEDFSKLREEVAEELDKMKKEHKPQEMKAMGLAGVEVCKGEDHKMWCHPKHAKKGEHHKGEHHAHKKEHKGEHEEHEEHGSKAEHAHPASAKPAATHE
ncbi:hypothetical protein NHP190012_08460 [Helicobacter sp. NHP19-012]|uniref:DUF1104 domain-containing protein n=1 Tax=Helicobacter gastrofelis TaxID=2849642 RepID=A0ABM7SI44_9HELI|nr:hypothetical protein NHP190012_08460 [Helicobacter sp. NHP19-012]